MTLSARRRKYCPQQPMLRYLGLAILVAFLPHTGEACCKGSKPDPTFVSETEYNVESVTPDRCPIQGGARITISGNGFNTNFFEAGNYVYIGDKGADEWVECDVIEGACTVECGGPKTIVCDTRPWPYESSLRTASGLLDIMVMIQVFGQAGPNEFVTVYLDNAFRYQALNYAHAPKMKSVAPRAASSEEAIQLQGYNWGYWIKDYRIIFVGNGRPPQGGNVNTGETNTHALCRPGILNHVHNPDAPFADVSTASAVVMREDFEADPINENVFYCGLGDFAAGSYNVSVYMDNDIRGVSSTNIAGLATVYDEDNYWDAHLLSYDSRGVLHELQYYPRIDSFSPTDGSFAGGTEITINGGGFSMDESENEVLVDGKICKITFSTLELIRCNTSAYGNETRTASNEASKVKTQIVYSALELDSAFADGRTSWMDAVDLVGNWTQKNGSIPYYSDEGNAAGKGQAWVTFAPPGTRGAVNVSGIYELFLRFPTLSELNDKPCFPRSNNASVVIRHAGGYSSVKLNDTSSVDSSGSGFVLASFGNFTFLDGATALMTVDNTGTEGACVTVGTRALMRFRGLIKSRGCTDHRAENFDVTVEDDDGSCLYLGSRGVESRNWSFMHNHFVLDDWYPKAESETWSTGDFCTVPSSSASLWNVSDCLHGKCEQHLPCGDSAFCCISDEHNGCSPVWSQSTNKEGWKLLFRQNTMTGGAWPKGVWRNNSGNPNSDMFSILDELESFRRPSDGMFEFKMCWPNSGFTECTHWIQTLSPQLNPKKTNMYATCVDCPYETDETDFRGLAYDGDDALLDADYDGAFYQIGVHSTTLKGPRSTNDVGASESPMEVTLWVRPDTNGPACISCHACYDMDGDVRMSEYSCAENPTYAECRAASLNSSNASSAAATYWAPACPLYCLDTTIVQEPRAAVVRAPHQMVVATHNMEEKPCFTVGSAAAYTDDVYNNTVCPGLASMRTDAIPGAPETFRVGGNVHRAFFVAPVSGNYSFHIKAGDGAEVWLSPDADPRSARRILSSRREHLDAFHAPESTNKASIISNEWTCTGLDNDRVCFRYFSVVEDHEYAETLCAGYGARLANPKTSAENTLIRSLALNRVWIGLSDWGTEGNWYFSDGSYGGAAFDAQPQGDWSYENWGNNEPNDAGGTENCAEMYTGGTWNDLACTSVRRVMCEIRDGGIDARETEPIAMVAGDVRYLEAIFYNSFDTATSLITLSIDSRFTGGSKFLTSEVLGLSAEYLREIRTDGRSVEVTVNGLQSACSAEDCIFGYSEEHTPTVASVYPSSAVPGTELTITGTKFSPLVTLNYVTIGGAECEISSSNKTFIVCTVPTSAGTAGTFPVEVNVYNLGLARHAGRGTVDHTILMRIDSLNPTNGSLLGGATVTITGVGFARFGLHNQIKLTVRNSSTVGPSGKLYGPSSRYSDDWLWGRGDLEPFNKTRLQDPTTELLCVPRTVKNRECAYSTEDSGFQCTKLIEWAYSDIATREEAEWFDYSTPTYIECVVESLSTPLANFTVAAVNISIVNSSVLLDADTLESDLWSAKMNFNCEVLSHCQMVTPVGLHKGWFGGDYTFNGFSHGVTNAFRFSADMTPVITHLVPEKGMPGQSIEIHGYNLAAAVEVTDKSWYMSEFGFYYQPYSATITVGSYECKLAFHNDTLIKCNAVYGAMYQPHELEVSIAGKGRAMSKGDGVIGRALNFTFALHIYDLSPSIGSLAGGTILTFTTSSLTSGADLGVATYDVHLVEDEGQAISKYIAEYLGLEQGVACKVRTSGEYFVTCVTAAVSGEPFASRTNGIWSEESGAWGMVGETRDVWLVAEWNRQEIYSRCSGSSCAFAYSKRYTPILELNHTYDAGHVLRDDNRGRKAIQLCVGDHIQLVEPLGLNSSWHASSNSFDWSSINVGDILWKINNVSLLDITLDVSAGAGHATLSGRIGNLTPPVLYGSSDLFVEPFGWGVVTQWNVSIVPVISSISHSSGSMAGGTRITMTGVGFASAHLQSIIVGGENCGDTVVDDRDGRTMWCVTSASVTEGWGAVKATFNGVDAMCNKTDHANTTNRKCQFLYAYNSTPTVHSISPAEGYYKHPDTITITGKRFADSGNIIKLGYQGCAVKKENSTHIECTVPRHVGGTYKATVENPAMGLAEGSSMWFRFHSGIRSITPKSGSKYFGQTITISGYGFAPKMSVENISTIYASLDTRRQLLSQNSTVPTMAPTSLPSSMPTGLPTAAPTTFEPTTDRFDISVCASVASPLRASPSPTITGSPTNSVASALSYDAHSYDKSFSYSFWPSFEDPNDSYAGFSDVFEFSYSYAEALSYGDSTPGISQRRRLLSVPGVPTESPTALPTLNPSSLPTAFAYCYEDCTDCSDWIAGNCAKSCNSAAQACLTGVCVDFFKPSPVPTTPAPSTPAPTPLPTIVPTIVEMDSSYAADDIYLEIFEDWYNEGAAAEYPFDLDVVSATFDTIVAKTNLESFRRIGASATDKWMRGLSIDTINDAHGVITPGSYAGISDANNQGTLPNLFDGDHSTYWWAGSSTYPSGDWVTYTANDAFLLTDYQIVWYSQNHGCPFSWVLYGYDTYAQAWDVLHTINTHRREAHFTYLNMTVETPGYYSTYYWRFTDANTKYHSYTILREIVLNPGGAARHYGRVQRPSEVQVRDTVTAGYTNVLYGKEAYQISTHGSMTASKSNNGEIVQYWGGCSLTGWTSNPYWYVDLGEEMSIDDIAVYGRTPYDYYKLTGGTYFGVSTSKCWETDAGCMPSTAGVTVCGLLTGDDYQANGQYHRSCTGKQLNNTVTTGAIGRYVFVWGDYTNRLMLCEVIAMGSPLSFTSANTSSVAQISTSPTPAFNTSVPTPLPTPAPTSARVLSKKTSNAKYTVFDNDGLFLKWDEALDKCQRHDMALATVRSAAEQAAFAAAFYDYHKKAALDNDNASETLLYSWVGGVYEDDAYSTGTWFWVDTSGAQDVAIGDGNYTNWESDSSTSSLRFMYANAVSFKWSSVSSYTNKADSFVCEERTVLPYPTYRRLFESPEIGHVEPPVVSAGTILTITGKHFNATGLVYTSNVTIGGRKCRVIPETLNDTQVLCTVPAQIDAGVYPVRVSSTVGAFGPAQRFLVTVSHSVYNITPASGSFGGGTMLTITGANFPRNAQFIDVAMETSKLRSSMVGNYSNSTFACAVKNSTTTSIVCETEAVPGARELFYNHNRSRIPNIATKIDAQTWLVPNGDKLRIVAQGAYNIYSDKYRSGIYIIDGETGTEHMVPNSDFHYPSRDGRRLAALAYDPISRTVVDSVVFEYVNFNSDLASFLNDLPPDYILVIVTHEKRYYEVSDELEAALTSCGGSEIWDSSATSGRGDAYQYILIGRCNAGLSAGYSAALGYEYKAVDDYKTLEIETDPLEYFRVTIPSNPYSVSVASLVFTFDEGRTPYVSRISRRNGTTAGGTTVQIWGEGFMPGNTTVHLAGVLCATEYKQIGSYRGQHLCEWDGVDCSGIGVSTTMITCLTGVWDFNGDAFKREVQVYVNGKGNAVAAPHVVWSYMNLWSSKTTWGGNDPPASGDSVVITYGEYIVLDVSPPDLYLITIQGTLEFSPDVGDLALNASYIVIQYGRLLIGSADEPFLNDATITIEGERTAYELPVYGAKTIAVRTGELALHGRPRVSWTKLAETARVGNTTIVVRDYTDWEVGDHLFMSSTEYNQFEAEELYITDISSDGRVIKISKPLQYAHWGEGWFADDDSGESIDAYRASVGLLTRNIVIQGDDTHTKAQQFGVQVVLSTESTTGDNPLLGQFSNVEVRQAGQGMKIGKYPIHFHLVGNVSKSYIKNCSVHHSFNRAIAVHGVDALLVEHNVVFDTRGHTIFTEDGTERFNIIRYNLVGVVRPIWSLLMVDQSPSCFWIVNPVNYVYGNVAAGSSHYGFWFRSLETPDGVSGQGLSDSAINRCPNYAELLQFEDNVAHSTGKHGLKVSNYFPLEGGYFCPSTQISAPAVFKNFSSFKNRHMGVWGEFLVDVHFDQFKLADHVKSGIEFKYINGRSAKFATSYFSDMLFVGRMYDEITTPESAPCLSGEGRNCQGPVPNGDEKGGMFYPSIHDVGNGWTHAIHLPGIGSEVKLVNSSFRNYQGMIYGCAWCVAHRGGYEMEFWNVSMHNVDHIVHFKHGVAGILIDGDGSLGAGPGGTIVPPTGQFRNNPNCTIHYDRYAVCTTVVHRVNVMIAKWTSPWWNTHPMKLYPLLIVTDIEDEELTPEWDKWNREPKETRLSCLGGPCGVNHYGTPKGAEACFEQAPKMGYSFMAAVGRRYLVTWSDENYMRVTADVDVSVLKMRPDEHMVLQFTERPPLYPRIPIRTTVLQGPTELWGELPPEFGAWSPPPNVPSYAIQDHSGNGATDPCASGVYTTDTYSDSCVAGRNFNAPELKRDPQVVKSGYDPENYFQELKATGTTQNGGMLHPFSGPVFYSNSWVTPATNSEDYKYRSFCLAINGDTELSGTETYFEECGTAANDDEGIYLAGTWKYGWSVEDGVFAGTGQLVLSAEPWYCLDVERDGSDDLYYGSPINSTGAGLLTYACDTDRATQRWYYKQKTGEVVNRGTGLCLGWGSIRSGNGVSLEQCDGSFVWDSQFWMPHNTTTAVHGSFYFDPWRNVYRRGVVQPRNVHNLTDSSSLYKVISSVPSASSFVDYTVWNTSVLSVVVAGNSTLSISAHKCPPGGCLAGNLNPSTQSATFFWSDNSTWERLNSTVPCDEDLSSYDEERGLEVCWSIIIWDGWTVILDVETPFLNKLEVRGTLIAQHNANKTIGINANILDIKGGSVIFGNETHPFTGRYGHITLHGDMYKHGKDCDNPIDVGDEGCYKKIKVNGILSVKGVERNVTVKLSADALKGERSLHVESPVDWVYGDELILSSSDVTGVPEYHSVLFVSQDGTVVTLQSALTSDHIGTTVSMSGVPLDGNGDVVVVDGRSTVSLLTRNIEIRGGYDPTYDYISGVGPDHTDYGATIHVQEGYFEDKNNWHFTDPGYEVYGRWWFPSGTITEMSWVRFRGCGKQFEIYIALVRFPVIDMSGSSGFELAMNGVVMTEPLGGMVFDKQEYVTRANKIDLTIRDSVFVGYGMNLRPNWGVTHTMIRSVMFGGEECRIECPPIKMLLTSTSGGGKIRMKDNVATGALGGIVIEGSCAGYELWENNLAMGNGVGYLLRPSESTCTSLRLIPYRNSIGVAAGTTTVSNVLAAENGVGIAPITDFLLKPSFKPQSQENSAADASLELVHTSTIIGVLPAAVDGDVRSSSCQVWSSVGGPQFPSGFFLGGKMAGYRLYHEYAYSGFAYSGPHKPGQGSEYGRYYSTFAYKLRNITFSGFTGTDSCGRKNVAISNEMAGDGEGGPDGGGWSAVYGKATCYPVIVEQSNFTNVPTYARVRFSEQTVQNGLCMLYDDGSLVGMPTDDRSVPYHQLVSSVPHEWPTEVLRDCTAWADLGFPDGEVGGGSCLWWIKFYSHITAAITNSNRRGVIHSGYSGTSYSSGDCADFHDDNSMLDTNALLCSGMDYVWLETLVPKRIVSGSELLYGPVGYINVYDAFMGSSYFATGKTTVDIYRDYTDPRGDQIPPQTGANTEKFVPADPRYTQPYLAKLVNRGVYRIEYTGDITAFNEEFLEYRLHHAVLSSPMYSDEEFVVIFDIKFLKAVNVAFYYNGLQVRMSPRRDKLSLDSPAGTNYLDPVSKVLSFVVKGTSKPVRIRQLDVITVDFGVATTFSDFFEDNLIDPNAIDAAYSDQVPPSYAASYDPDNGNIVRSNTFIRNLANVLNINPSRIRVTNIVPGNRRRLKDRGGEGTVVWQGRELLADDSGLGVEFEISATDPCDGVACAHGDCNVDGMCDCEKGWTGSSCNTTAVNCTRIENILLPACNFSAPTSAPSFVPSRAPSVLPTMNTSNVISNSSNSSSSSGLVGSPTVAPTAGLSSYAELMSVASSLSDSAASGGLDTGYEITDVAVALPDDVCGVAGGDGTTCDDACGVANGDNSTCADICGVPNGDGTSCLSKESGFYTCEAESDGSQNAKQAIVLRSYSGGFSGSYRLSFNGQVTGYLAAQASAEDISIALENLATVGTLKISANQTLTSTGKVSQLDIFIEFTRDTGTYPSHYGPMPLVLLDSSSLSGVTYEDAAHVCTGAYRTSYSLEEQLVTVQGDLDLNGSFALIINATGSLIWTHGTTATIYSSDAAPAVTAALTATTWSPTPDDFEITEEYFEVFEVNATSPFAAATSSINGSKVRPKNAAWLVRWYLKPSSNLLYLTNVGDILPMYAVTVDLYAGASVTVTEQTQGSVPASAMPVTATEAAAESGAEAQQAAEAVVSSFLEVIEVIHVCGDGVLTTAEGCDDGARVAGDGCSRNCTVEDGYVCTDSLGSTSSCFVPEDPTLYFKSSDFGPFDEGTSGIATVRRMGWNGTAVSVSYSVASSTAYSSRDDNDVCAKSGDFNVTSGTLSFAVGQMEKYIEVPLRKDGIYEQTLVQYEKLVVLLSNPVGADLDSERSSAFIKIRDLDIKNFTVGYCFTSPPSNMPTPYPSLMPTLVPSPKPTLFPTLAPTRVPTPVPTAGPSLLPTSLPTLVPTMAPTTPQPTHTPSLQPSSQPTPETPYPSKSPTSNPTLAPSGSPGPTPQPTLEPSSEPSRGPTLAPTSTPTLMPSPEPSRGPTRGPTSTPTLAPTSSPTLAPTSAPSLDPTEQPTSEPTQEPTSAPSLDPTAHPTSEPTQEPTSAPSLDPTAHPTIEPTLEPTLVPTLVPTDTPTKTPTSVPTPVRPNPTPVPTLLAYTSAKVSSGFVVDGLDRSKFTPKHRRVMKQVVVSTIALIDDISAVTHLNVSEYSARRLGTDLTGRTLLGTSTMVAFTIELVVENTAHDDSTAVVDSISSDMSSAVSSGGLTSTIATHAAESGVSLNVTVDTTVVVTPTVETSTVVRSLPSAAPTLVPTGRPSTPPTARPTNEAVDTDSDTDEATVTYIVIGAVGGLLATFMAIQYMKSVSTKGKPIAPSEDDDGDSMNKGSLTEKSAKIGIIDDGVDESKINEVTQNHKPTLQPISDIVGHHDEIPRLLAPSLLSEPRRGSQKLPPLRGARSLPPGSNSALPVSKHANMVSQMIAKSKPVLSEGEVNRELERARVENAALKRSLERKRHMLHDLQTPEKEKQGEEGTGSSGSTKEEKKNKTLYL